MINRYLQPVIHWIQKTIGPWINLIWEFNPYAPYLMIVLVWLIVALMQIHKKRPKIKIKKKPKRDPAPEGGYTNFKGEVWFPDGRRWNEDTQKWETSDYTDPPAPAGD